jgi:anti-anti-sigma factor
MSRDSIQRVNLVASAAGNLSRVIVNLSHLAVIPTVFQGMLLALRRRVGDAGGQLRLCGLNLHAQKSFRFTKLDNLFDIRDNEQNALASF